MSDHDAAPDPIDQAYVQAETVLGDEEARTERRARVLAAVAHEARGARRAPRRPGAPTATFVVARRRFGGLSLLLALHMRPPAPVRPEQAPPPDRARSGLPNAATAHLAAPAAPAPIAPSPGLQPVRRHDSEQDGAAPERAARPSPLSGAALQPPAPAPDVPSIPPLPVPPVEQRVEAPASPQPPSQDVIVTGRRRLQTTAPRAFPADDDSDRAGTATAGLAADQAARLGAAAASGRIGEVEALLAQGVPVDSAGADGETALMRSIRAGQPEVAAFLRARAGRVLTAKIGPARARAPLRSRKMIRGSTKPWAWRRELR